MPLRDERRGTRATLGSAGSPLRPNFSDVVAAARDDHSTSTSVAVDRAPAPWAKIPSEPSERSPQDDAVIRADEAPAAVRTTAARPGFFAISAWLRSKLDVTAVAVDTAARSNDAGAGGLAKATGLEAAVAADTAAPRDGAGAGELAKATELDRDAPRRPGVREALANYVARMAASIARRSGNKKGLLEAAGAALPAAAGAARGAETLVIERSFASELASFIAPPHAGRAPSAQAHALPSALGDAPSSDAAPVILQTAPTAFDRVLPLTRLPLRTHVATITWPALMPAMLDSPTRAERHSLLAALAREPDPAAEAALLDAYRQEDGQGRVLALRALMRGRYVQSHRVFVEALRAGTDEERALAVDGLADLGDRAGITAAFADRVDAIAAKAVLAYVGATTPLACRAALAPYMDASRADALLELLAGIIE